jgi:hypothetical protein
LGINVVPLDTLKRIKWDDKNDATYGLRTSISSDLQCHPQGIKILDEAWKKTKNVFGKHNQIQAYQLEK